jgi:8-oxo-dGTP pyrophosphatase MutT (NUDIX family)
MRSPAFINLAAIALPGLLLAYLLAPEAEPEDALSWALLLLAAGLLGVLNMLASAALGGLYAGARVRTMNRQIATLARGGPLRAAPIRAALWLVFGEEQNHALIRAERLRKQALAPLQMKDALSTQGWCRALLALESPVALGLVLRAEAEARFCRALTMALLLGAWALPLLLMVLPLTLWAYLRGRHGAEGLLLAAAITLSARQGVSLPPARNPPGSPTHAGGVVFRLHGGTAQYLLIEANDERLQWVLPKGHIEDGEHPPHAAVREVREETGIWAALAGELGDIAYMVGEKQVISRFYLMRAVGQGVQQDSGRGQRWLPFAQAMAEASHDNTRELLQAAELARTTPRQDSP